MLKLVNKLPQFQFSRILREQSFTGTNFYKRLKTPKAQKMLKYEFKFQNLKNPMIDKYIPVKESILCGIQGARKKRKRIGRGPGSGLGKTSGKGHKGSGQRGTKKKYGFEGGQTPIQQRQPKLGKLISDFKIRNKALLRRIVEYYQRGWLDWNENEYLTIKQMKKSGCINSFKNGIILLEQGFELLDQIDKPLFIEVNEITDKAFEEITKRGGKVRIVHRNRQQLMHHVHNEQFIQQPPDQYPRLKEIKQLERYRQMGCEVIYKKPQWVDEELKKKQNIFIGFDKNPFKEIVEQTKQLVKPIIPKKYKFILKQFQKIYQFLFKNQPNVNPIENINNINGKLISDEYKLFFGLIFSFTIFKSFYDQSLCYFSSYNQLFNFYIFSFNKFISEFFQEIFILVDKVLTVFSEIDQNFYYSISLDMIDYSLINSTSTGIKILFFLKFLSLNEESILSLFKELSSI